MSVETVQIRQRGANNFDGYYRSLCALESIAPVSSILAASKQNKLKCNTSLLRQVDWHPLLTALRINKTLHTVHIYQKWEELYGCLKGFHLPVRRARRGARTDRKDAAHSSTTTEIVRSVRECLGVSPVLKSLSFEGIVLKLKDVSLLSKGLMESIVLSHLSLKGTQIGDKGAEALCYSLKSLNVLTWLDLTACEIGTQGASCIAEVIKHQCTSRQAAAWKESLRHHRPNLESIQGLRRITLNLNPKIGDKGASELAGVLADDKWVKAIDLQSCGISSVGANAFREALLLNSFVLIIDLRDNELIDDDIFDDICDQLTSNAAPIDNKQAYSYLEMEIDRIGALLLSCARPPINGVLKRSCSSPPYGVPVVHVRKESKATSRFAGSKALRTIQSRSTSPSRLNSTGLSLPKFNKAESVIKALKVELMLCQQKLKEESDARAAAENKADKLEAENNTLREEVRKVHAQLYAQNPSRVVSTSGVVVSEDTFEVVETAFQQFHRFLDSLGSKEYSCL